MVQSETDQPIDVHVTGPLWTPPRPPAALEAIVLSVALLCTAAFLLVAGLTFAVVPWYLPMILAVAGILPLIRWAVRARRGRRVVRLVDRISQRVSRNGMGALQIAVEDELAAGDACLVRHALPSVVQNLCRAGRTGFAVRYSIDRESQPEPLPPLLVPFEPVPLDESEEACRGLAASPAAEEELNSADRGGHSPVGKPPLLGGHYARERDWRSLMGIRGFSTAGFLVLFVLYLKGFTVWWMLWPALFVAGPLAFVLSLLPRGPGNQTWIFPGGIAVPAHVFRRGWWIVRRSEGILITQPSAGTLLVVTPERVKAVHGTASETELALRAWFAPVPSPTDDQLREFFA